MNRIRLIVAALFLISPFAAQADAIPVLIEFDSLGATAGPFQTTHSNVATPNGNCPTVAPDVSRPCAQFNMNSLLTFVLTGGGEFDLIDFYWRSTGGQQNSDMALSYTRLGDITTLAFGNLPGRQNVDDSVHQTLDLIGITSVTFQNASSSVTRIDNIMFSYDDGRCNGDRCPDPDPDPDPDPNPVPEPGTLALLGIGLLGMGLSRRRKTVA